MGKGVCVHSYAFQFLASCWATDIADKKWLMLYKKFDLKAEWLCHSSRPLDLQYNAQIKEMDGWIDN